MNTTHVRISGPYTVENLSLFLLHAATADTLPDYATLEEALQKKKVIVHETGDVNQLEIENLFEAQDLFIQAGEIVRGGRQDRTFGVDFVVPARSGRVPIPSFCVEHGRWGRRRGESEAQFSLSSHTVSTKALRRAVMARASQGEVWRNVEEAQARLSRNLGEKVASEMSPSSYELAMDHPKLKERQAAYLQPLAQLIDQHPDAVGLAFAINSRLDGADVYGSRALFCKLWRKLLDAAVIEAMAESTAESMAESMVAQKESFTVPGVDQVGAWLDLLSRGAGEDRSLSARVRVTARHTPHGWWFETTDAAASATPVHESGIGN